MLPTCGASRRSPFLVALAALSLVTLGSGRAIAGPPYETDDPDPTSYRNYEIYFHVDYHRIDDHIESDAGTLEINYGILPNTQFSIALPDLEIGIKYRFIQESARRRRYRSIPRSSKARSFSRSGRRNRSESGRSSEAAACSSIARRVVRRPHGKRASP